VALTIRLSARAENDRNPAIDGAMKLTDRSYSGAATRDTPVTRPSARPGKEQVLSKFLSTAECGNPREKAVSTANLMKG
jgi:hypothetical protein